MSTTFPEGGIFDPETNYMRTPEQANAKNAIRFEASRKLDDLSKSLGWDFSKKEIIARVVTDKGSGLRIRDENGKRTGLLYNWEEFKIVDRKQSEEDPFRNFIKVIAYDNKGKLDQKRSGWVAEDYIRLDKSVDTLLKTLEKKVKAPTSKPEAIPEPIKSGEKKPTTKKPEIKTTTEPYPGKKTLDTIIQKLKNNWFNKPQEQPTKNDKKAVEKASVPVEAAKAPEISAFERAMNGAQLAEYEGDYGTALEKYREAKNAPDQTEEDEMRSPDQKIQEMQQKIQALKDGFKFVSAAQFIYQGATYTIGNIGDVERKGNQETIDALSKVSQYEIWPSQNTHKVILTIWGKEIPVNLRGDWQKNLRDAIAINTVPSPGKIKDVETPEKIDNRQKTIIESINNAKNFADAQNILDIMSTPSNFTITNIYQQDLDIINSKLEKFKIVLGVKWEFLVVEVNAKKPGKEKSDVVKPAEITPTLPATRTTTPTSKPNVVIDPYAPIDPFVRDPKSAKLLRKSEMKPEETKPAIPEKTERKPETKEAMTYDALIQKGETAEGSGDFQGALNAYEDAWKTVEGEENTPYVQWKIDDLRSKINTAKPEIKKPEVIKTPQEGAKAGSELFEGMAEHVKIEVIVRTIEDLTPENKDFKKIIQDTLFKIPQNSKLTPEQLGRVNNVLKNKNLRAQNINWAYILLENQPQEKKEEKKDKTAQDVENALDGLEKD